MVSYQSWSHSLRPPRHTREWTQSEQNKYKCESTFCSWQAIRTAHCASCNDCVNVYLAQPLCLHHCEKAVHPAVTTLYRDLPWLCPYPVALALDLCSRDVRAAASRAPSAHTGIVGFLEFLHLLPLQPKLMTAADIVPWISRSRAAVREQQRSKPTAFPCSRWGWISSLPSSSVPPPPSKTYPWKEPVQTSDSSNIWTAESWSNIWRVN